MVSKHTLLKQSVFLVILKLISCHLFFLSRHQINVCHSLFLSLPRHLFYLHCFLLSFLPPLHLVFHLQILFYPWRMSFLVTYFFFYLLTYFFYLAFFPLTCFLNFYIKKITKNISIYDNSITLLRNAKFKDISNGWFMAFNATYNNISVILWQLVLLVEETGVPGENSQMDISSKIYASLYWNSGLKSVQE